METSETMATLTAADTIRGLTWSHSRAFPPLVAATQLLEDFDPTFQVTWDRRSLWHFGEGDVHQLRDYDVLVVDHPTIGALVELELVAPIDDLLSEREIANLERESVGRSLESYRYRGRLWAVPVDAAAQSAALNPDEAHRRGISLPVTFREVVEIAGAEQGLAMPLAPIHVLCSLLGLCNSLEAQPEYGTFFSLDAIAESLELLCALASKLSPDMLDLDPIGALSRLVNGEAWFVPHTFTYIYYARPAYAALPARFVGSPSLGSRGAVSTLGGAGLAVTRHADLSVAKRLLRWLISERCQNGIYLESGGQPANAMAWAAEGPNGFLPTRAWISSERMCVRPMRGFRGSNRRLVLRHTMWSPADHRYPVELKGSWISGGTPNEERTCDEGHCI